jgi:hypothetical protein
MVLSVWFHPPPASQSSRTIPTPSVIHCSCRGPIFHELHLRAVPVEDLSNLEPAPSMVFNCPISLLRRVHALPPNMAGVQENVVLIYCATVALSVGRRLQSSRENGSESLDRYLHPSLSADQGISLRQASRQRKEDRRGGGNTGFRASDREGVDL